MEDYFKVNGTDLTVMVPVELDHHNAEKIKRGADRMIESSNIRRIIFDFRRTRFMDSSGIGMIMGRYKNMRFMGGAVIAVHVNGRVQRILRLSGIYKVIDIYEESPDGCGK
ncbi:MAG: anti-sigma factor antagonist [Eubacteriales bacterium]|nr:anti-sigma factor antagonist [Eubacteriales bacterium]